jgi:hypothetical protein
MRLQTLLTDIASLPQSIVLRLRRQKRTAVSPNQPEAPGLHHTGNKHVSIKAFLSVPS